MTIVIFDILYLTNLEIYETALHPGAKGICLNLYKITSRTKDLTVLKKS